MVRTIPAMPGRVNVACNIDITAIIIVTLIKRLNAANTPNNP